MRLTVRLPTKQFDRLYHEARAERESMSAYIRRNTQVPMQEVQAPLLILTDFRSRRTQYVVQATAGAELVGLAMRLDPKGDVGDLNFGLDDSLFELIHG